MGRHYDRLLELLHAAGSIVIGLMMAVIAIDVAGRALFSAPLVGTPEIVASSVPLVAFLQMPYLLRKGRHLRSTLLLERLRPGARKATEMVAALLGFLVFAIAVQYGWERMIASWNIREYVGEGALRVPVYPVRTVITLGSVLMAVEFLRQLVCGCLYRSREEGTRKNTTWTR